MLLRDECKPFFDAIRQRLEKKGEMPRALEALKYLQEAREAVALVDSREAYLKEALTKTPGTILIYLENNRHRPIRRRVIGVDRSFVTVEWHDPHMRQRRFEVTSGCACDDRSATRISTTDVLDMQELRDLLASLPRPTA